MVSASWEGRHPRRRELWGVDFFTADASLGGFVGLTFLPDRRRCWYWAALVGDHRPYLLVRDLEVALPRLPASREIRSEALWADMNCESPFEHWSFGLEAFGVAMDEPDEALGAERGERVGLGLDVEWESVGDIVGGEGSTTSRVWCTARSSSAEPAWRRSPSRATDGAGTPGTGTRGRGPTG